MAAHENSPGADADPALEPDAPGADPGADPDLGAGAAGAGAPRPARRRRLLAALFVTAALVYVADLITKIIAVEKLSGREPVEIVGTLFQFELVRNPGAAFGIGVGMTVVFSLLSFVVVLVILRTAGRLGSLAWALVFGLVLGGALGNLTDRVLRSPGFLRGHVIDFLHLQNWPVFNLADTAFCIAAAIVLILVIRNIPLEGRPDADRAPR